MRPLIEKYVQERRKKVAPATVNRQLATLRRALRLAHEWKVIDRLPKIRLLQGERTREFVLSREQEPEYLKAAPQPLKDLALLMLDTGLRDGEALALRWADVHMQPAPTAKFGYLQVQKGKVGPGAADRKPDRASTNHAGYPPRKVLFGIRVPKQDR